MNGTEIKVIEGYIHIKTPATKSLLASLGMLTSKATKISKKYDGDSDVAIIIEYADAQIIYEQSVRTRASDLYDKFTTFVGRPDISRAKFGRVLASELGLKSSALRIDGVVHRVYKGITVR